MRRLYVVVEGQSEVAFVRRTLASHLNARQVWTTAIEVTTKRDRKTGQKLFRGGGLWKQWRQDITILTKSQPGKDACFTTLFDLYGLPDDFPGLSTCRAEKDTNVRAGLLEAAMAGGIDDHRFLPYLQRHEFEALVLAGLDKLPALLPGQVDRAGVDALQRSLGDLSPEDVNDGHDTAPSKRLLEHVPGYRKVTMGPSVIEALGLAALRAKCPRFDAWIAKLEALGEAQ